MPPKKAPKKAAKKAVAKKVVKKAAKAAAVKKSAAKTVAKKAAPQKPPKKAAAKKAVKSAARKTATAMSTTPMRFAHPFFTDVPQAERTNVKGVGKRMTDFISTKLEAIPAPLREPTMTLQDIIGTDGSSQVTASGSMILHAVGDTGHVDWQGLEFVADAMAADYDTTQPDKTPAFFLHLGDVIYYDNTDRGYQSQFYVPYKKYPGKIIAIPGNHDGELFKYDGTSVGQKKTLDAFKQNFCQPKAGVPAAAGTIFRQMVNQPGVYWVLNTEFADIIGLYSNIAEGPGYISGTEIGTKQKDWLTKTLKGIGTKRKSGEKKALIIAVHHPPLSHGSHTGSTEMLADIDDCCNQASVTPDLVLAAHAHSYQRFTRFMPAAEGAEREVPYIVAGCGGRGIAKVSTADGVRTGDHTFDNSFAGYGYLILEVSRTAIKINVTKVDGHTGEKSNFETIHIDLEAGKVTVQ